MDILEKYLAAYTTALKRQPFKLMYIDAFAGTGAINPRGENEDARSFIDGSTRRAIKIDDKPFDRLIFVEKDPDRYGSLTALLRENPSRDIRIEMDDANSFLSSMQEDWRSWRGVLFIDPFATEVEWKTIERIAGFNALDTWILFPLSAIARMLPKGKNPAAVSDAWANRLTRIFGDESWSELYRPSSQLSLFGDDRFERYPGMDGIREIYKNKLKNLFERRFMENSKVFVNSKNSPLFEFVFCAGNQSGAALAKKIAGHILNASE